MKQMIFSKLGLVVLAAIALAAIGVINVSLSNARLDLTEDKLFTLSSGTKNILANLDTEIELTFFFSDKQTKDYPPLRNYAKHIKELLAEFGSVAQGKINVRIVDPEPFSEAEDQAAEYGLQGMPLNAGGDQLYLGLAGENNQGNSEVIPFFQPDQESFLEYEIAQLIYKLEQNQKPTIGLVSALPVQGGYNPLTQQPSAPWMAIAQLDELFDIQMLDQGFTDLSREDYELVIVIHPKNLAEDQRYALDQFVLAGGHALIFVDPFAEQDISQFPGSAPTPPSMASDLPDLFAAWGITMEANKVVIDGENALAVGTPMGRRIRHFGLYQFSNDNFNDEDIVLVGLENINLSSAGHLTPLDEATTEFIPLIQSSEYAALADDSRFKQLTDPIDLSRGFRPSGERYTLAARVTGSAKTAFPDKVAAAAQNKTNASEDSEAEDQGESNHTPLAEGDINVMVVADTDLLSDRLWVQVQRFFGQNIVRPFADNGGFINNSVDNMLGSADLISIRSRGKFARPFEHVKGIQREAEARFREEEEALQARLQEMEQKIFALENQKDENDQPLVLNDAQKAELENFRKEKLNTRKALRNVQHQLNRDIEALGTKLKLINIFAVPALLTVLGIGMRFRRRRS